MTINIYSLFTVETAQKLYKRGLEVAQAVGLAVTSWRDGDPTKSFYEYLARVLAARDEQRASLAKSGFMSTAEGDYATLLAKDVYNVDRGEATYATPTITLHNVGGGYYDFAAGSLRVKCSATGKTFRSTNYPGALSSGTTRTYELIADEAGAASSVAADELDEIVSSVDNVTIVSSTSAAASDEQSIEELRDQCGDTLGALSPNGPPDAYEYVCKNSELTGVSEINRATAIGDATDGSVLVYVASASGAVSAPSVAAAQTAVLKWATPLTIGPQVFSAAPVTVSVSAQILGSDIPADFATKIGGALGALFLGLPIGGTVYRSRIIATIHGAVPQVSSVNLVTPAADVTLTADQVPVVGTVGITEI